MNILEELTGLLNEMQMPSATGHYGGVPPDEYIVIVPLADSFDLAADNLPQADVQEARLALYTKDNFTAVRYKITAALLQHGFTVTDRRYIGYEEDTKFHHLAIDVAKSYPLEV